MITNIDQDDIKEYYLFHKEFYNEMKKLLKKLLKSVKKMWLEVKTLKIVTLTEFTSQLDYCIFLV